MSEHGHFLFVILTFSHDITFDTLDRISQTIHPSGNFLGKPFSPIFSHPIRILSPPRILQLLTTQSRRTTQQKTLEDRTRSDRARAHQVMQIRTERQSILLTCKTRRADITRQGRAGKRISAEVVSVGR